jgi:hypothetical protein
MRLDHTLQRYPQFWQTASLCVLETTLVFLENKAKISFGRVRKTQAKISHHQPMMSQYSKPFFRFSLTMVTA